MSEWIAPLAGVKVLELSTSAAGQIAGMLLADLGADVVRVVDVEDLERVAEPARLCWNRGKTFVGDRVDLERLVATAELLLSDGTPREHGRDQLDADSLAERAPGLCSVWLPPTVAFGEWAELPADHILLDGLTGLAAFQQGTTDAPLPTVVPGTHVIHGALGALAGVAGLFARRRDGWGRSAIVSGLQAGAAATFALGSIALDGPQGVGSIGRLPGPPHMRLYQAGDGRWLYLAAISFDYFIRALEVLDRLDVLAHPTLGGEFINVMRPEAMADIGRELASAFRERPCADWLTALAANHVPAAEAGEPSEWLTGDVLAHACPPVTRTSAARGTVVLPGPALTFESSAMEVGALADDRTAIRSGDVWVGASARSEPAGERRSEAGRPLAGVRVVDMTTFMAGPFAGALLAQCGADVVKVEPPGGDPYATYNAAYALMNHDKRRLELDLRQGADRATFLGLVGGVDLVIDNLAASSLERLDLLPELFRDVNPSLVRCSVSAYGTEGPYAERPGFDQMVQAMSGLMTAQGSTDRPVAISFPIHDITTACLISLGSVAALLARQRGCSGQRVYASLAAASALVQSAEITSYAGRPPRLTGGVDWPGPDSWRRYYRAADRWIGVSATTAASRRSLLDAVGRPDLWDADDSARASVLGATLGTRAAGDWLETLGAAGVPSCPVAGRLEFELPHLVENGYTHVLTIPDVGRVRIPAGFITWTDAPGGLNATSDVDNSCNLV